MKLSKIAITGAATFLSLITIAANAAEHGKKAVPDEVIEAHRAALAESTKDAGFGPQSPRDIDVLEGVNQQVFSDAPNYQDMNLCNIHFHDGAEHKGGQFTTFRGNGDGEGFGTGYAYSGTLSEAELATDHSGHDHSHKQGDIAVGDTIELHYVHSSAKVSPGPTLGACLSDAVLNPQLRVETQVFVLVNDDNAANFMDLTEVGMVNGKHQALNIPNNTGEPIQYTGSTTGPSFNEVGSPLKVTWSVRPEVIKVDIDTVNQWFESNVFDETKAHGTRNLVINPSLLSVEDL